MISRHIFDDVLSQMKILNMIQCMRFPTMWYVRPAKPAHTMIVKLLTKHHLEFLSLKEGCRGSSASTLVKMSNCWKSHAAAHTLKDFKNAKIEIHNIYQLLMSQSETNCSWSPTIRLALTNGYRRNIYRRYTIDVSRGS